MRRTDGNTAEIEFLYRQHASALVLYAVTITGDRASAQDVVQQVFLNLVRDQSLSRAADKKAYLFACVRNAALNDNKRQKRNTELDPDSPWFDPPYQDFAGEQNLRRALIALSDDQRQVVMLRVWGELTFAQIGELLGITLNTASSRYRYALEKLRQLMSTKENSCADSR